MLENFFKKEILVFRAVYKARSMTIASGVLNITQSAVSKAISSLESEIGSSLFVRTKVRLLPTEDANVLFEQSNKIFMALDNLREEPKQKETLKVGCHASIGIDFIPIQLINLMSKDNINVKFKFQNSKISTQDVIARSLDVAIVASPTKDKSLVISKISKQSIFLFRGSDSESNSKKRTLYNPDQIGIVKAMGKINSNSDILVNDYEVSASLVKTHAQVFDAILPDHIGNRHGLTKSSTELHSAQISLIYRHDSIWSKHLRRHALF
ncbi:MAG: LysR family transcriptional regulator [Bdellovibrionales bacterium]